MNDHERASDLMPWFANGSIRPQDAAWLSAHLANCGHCRRELAIEQRVRDAVVHAPALEFAPQVSFDRLWQRIESQAHPAAKPRQRKFPSLRWGAGRWIAAGIAAQIFVASVLGLALWRIDNTPRGDFHTVTDLRPVAAAGSIRVVLDDSATLAEIRDLLQRTRLNVRSGPTSAGVVTLIPDPDGAAINVDQALATLRSDARVRFAERVPD